MTTSAGRHEKSLRQAKTPVGLGVQPVFGALWALLVVALGVVGVRDALVYAGLLSGSGWCEEAAAKLDGKSVEAWMVPAGAALAILGLALVVIALRRRPKRGIRVTATTGIYLSSRGIQRLAQAAAADVDGVDTTTVSATRRKIRVDATTFLSQPEQAEEHIKEAVHSRLSALETAPTVRVRVRRAEGLT